MLKKEVTTYLKGNRNIRKASDCKGYVVWDRLLDLIVSNDILELCFWDTGLDFIADLESVNIVEIGDERLVIGYTGGNLILHREDCEKVADAIRGNV